MRTNTAVAKPKLDASERAARELLNRKVREGVIDRRNANSLLKEGLPLVRSMLAQWRLDGCSPEWITGKFQEKLTAAKEAQAAATSFVGKHMATGRVVAAEMYLAVWAGMQEDLGQYRAGQAAQRPAID